MDAKCTFNSFAVGMASEKVVNEWGVEPLYIASLTADQIADRCVCGTCTFCLHCVTPVVLTSHRCEFPRCHGCAYDLLVRVRDLCAQATKSS